MSLDGSLGDLQPMVSSFVRSLRAENLSPRTIETYTEAAEGLRRFLVARGMPTNVATIHREHVEAFIEELLRTSKPATAANRFRALTRLFGFLVEEGEIASSPMERMKAPRIPEQAPKVLTDDQLRDLIKACDGPGFEDHRDAAIVRTFIDTGARLAEVTGLTLADVDLDQGTLLLTQTKGKHPRVVALGAKSVRALDRYLRRRREHPAAHLETPYEDRGLALEGDADALRLIDGGRARDRRPPTSRPRGSAVTRFVDGDDTETRRRVHLRRPMPAAAGNVRVVTSTSARGLAPRDALRSR